MPNKKILPVILCGGTGSRLWPLSRESYPKQYLSLCSSEKRTFLQKTQERLKGFENIEDPIIICNEEHRFIVAEQLREIKVKKISSDYINHVQLLKLLVDPLFLPSHQHF